MNDVTPREIRLFEGLQIFAALADVLQTFVALHAVKPNALIWAIAIIGLTLLVSRARQKWPRWILAVMFFLATLGIVVSLFRWNGAIPVSWLIVPSVVVVHCVGLLLAFCSESSEWLARRLRLA